MGTQNLTEKTRVNLPVGVAWSIVLGLASVVAAVGYAASEMKQMRCSFDDLAAQLKSNNAALVQIDKRLAVVEDMRERVQTLEEKLQATREALLKHCARTGDTSKVVPSGGGGGDFAKDQADF